MYQKGKQNDLPNISRNQRRNLKRRPFRDYGNSMRDAIFALSSEIKLQGADYER